MRRGASDRPACGEKLDLSGLYRQTVARCDRPRGHELPHTFYTDDMAGRPVVVEWDDRSSRAHLI